ncbi:MAG: hypothetical protein COU81_02020 [Candidatus Portnoybacteria bacterium CG10_big_fil_rev_8_21_14_0_10_36_7]|uniref:Glycosyltransferase family 1 protein n=1 Tax=Candidatus Portnoybacteria bacterium CG10_big_fil_rev_8_21_14_0_10_36_7 TaxID=1974812 RepID=A0A2M8KE29_9BACT|nr:MAG: hypothetical protein COU81_02020 [Candidatus Portnoybacteria bacterium CG10_big_fil_rev_8_21_14_0_10_36_7]
MKFKSNVKKIGIDARFLGVTGKGLGRYAEQLIKNLESQDSINEYIVFLTKNNWDSYAPKNKNFKKVLADFRWYSWQEQIIFPYIILKHNISLMHFLHFNVPLFCPTKFIMTVHDLILHRYPTRRASTLGPIKWIFKNIFYRIIFFVAIHRTKKIIAVSKFTKKDILSEFKLSSEKIVVIYEGSALKCGTASYQDKLFSEKSFLYVGNAYPHKNLKLLIDAFCIFSKDFPDYQLLLVGQSDYFYERLKAYVARKGIMSIVFLGALNDDELEKKYRMVMAVILPSFYEGFGLVGVEALSLGVPVISANSTALPEIFGQHALYFDPNQVNELVDKMQLLCQNQSLRRSLVEGGFKHIGKYDWEKNAQKTIMVYNQV